MITLYFKNGEQDILRDFETLQTSNPQLAKVYCVDATPTELEALQHFFELDLAILSSVEDIELSSHYKRTTEQLAFNINIPRFSEDIQFEEEEFVVVIRKEVLFCFLSASVRQVLEAYQQLEVPLEEAQQTGHWTAFFTQIAIISDYYADLTELITSKIKGLYIDLLSKHNYEEKDLDFITVLKLNNHLIKSSLNRFQRILLLLEKSNMHRAAQAPLQLELQDLIVVSEHVQYNFDRLDGLKDNINIKIDLEQNKIFRTLTVITVCISLPTLVAGIYGMNFTNMPELDWRYGYWLVLGVMLFLFLGALWFFKYKKWIR
jgi:magnesium transporter